MGALRQLEVSQQVGLLFLALFGMLTLVTVAAFYRSLREPAAGPQAQALHERFKRDLRVVWLGAMLFWVAWVVGAFVSTLLFGVLSFLALREFVTLTHTRRGDHRSLLLAFFVVLPLQYVIAGTRGFDLFTVFIPVYVFLAIPIVSALGNDPKRFLERTAKIQWGIMVCVYGMSHAPALLLLDLPGFRERGAFLVLYLVGWWRWRRSRKRRRAGGCGAGRWRAPSAARFRGAAGSSARRVQRCWAGCCTGPRLSSRCRRW